jgi:hypothetical protein
MPGIGGGGGGGAPGAAGGCEADDVGIGGAGGGALGAPELGIGGAGGGADGLDAAAGDDAASRGGAVVGLLTLGDDTPFLSPAAESGLGGPMVPKRIEASCAALDPPGLLSSSSSSSSSSLSEPHPSSSRALRTNGTGGVAVACAAALPSCVMRKKGFLELASD